MSEMLGVYGRGTSSVTQVIVCHSHRVPPGICLDAAFSRLALSERGKLNACSSAVYRNHHHSADLGTRTPGYLHRLSTEHRSLIQRNPTVY